MTTVAGSGFASHADGVASAAAFSSPYGIAMDTTGVIYIGDTNNNRIRVFLTTGMWTAANLMSCSLSTLIQCLPLL